MIEKNLNLIDFIQNAQIYDKAFLLIIYFWKHMTLFQI